MLSEDFCAHKTLSLKFIQIFADDHGTFYLVFAVFFTNCYNSNELPQLGMCSSAVAATFGALLITSAVVRKPSEASFGLALWRAGKPLLCRNTTVWIFNRDPILKWGRFTWNDQILCSTVVNDSKGPDVDSVTPQSYDVFRPDGSRNICSICGARVNFWRPFTLNSSHLCCTNGLGEASKLTLSPGARNRRHAAGLA